MAQRARKVLADALDETEAADYLGISRNTLRTFRYHPERGSFPPPDGYVIRGMGRPRHGWKRTTLDAWRTLHPARNTTATKETR